MVSENQNDKEILLYLYIACVCFHSLRSYTRTGFDYLTKPAFTQFSTEDIIHIMIMIKTIISANINKLLTHYLGNAK